MGEQRNLFLAVGIAIAILLVYQFLVIAPMTRRAQEERARQVEAAQALGVPAPGQPAAGATADPLSIALTREDALSRADRVPIRTPEIVGSIALTGGLIDDVSLARYTNELDPASGMVTVLNPAQSPNGFFAYLGWATAEGTGSATLPGPTTQWRRVEGQTLTPQTPVVLAYDAPDGLQFRRTVSVDDHFMFTVVDRVTNASGEPVTLRPYGEVERRGVPSGLVGGIVHEGLIGVFNNSLIMRRYKRMQNDRLYEHRSVGGWVGITDKYWFAGVIPDPAASLDGEYRVDQSAGQPLFQARWIRDPEQIADGQWVEFKSYVFAGAKRAEILRDYEATLGIHRLNDAIDWGSMFWFLTKPFFFVLEYFFQLTGNFGVAILMLVVVLKIITFPLANMSFKSMARMKALQPKVTEMRERFKADPQRQQKEMMALYQREKVNPLAGCLPLIVQIPVFYALYKTLFVTIEMRHAPFWGWIRDLSARDPTNIWNLFGLLPYDPSSVPGVAWLIGNAGFLGLGVLPLLYGITMAVLQTLNPPPPDPTQQKIFAFMPWIFMFIMAPFAAGLLIYWIWNNVLSFAQQYFIMRTQKVDTPIGSFIAKHVRRFTGRQPAPGGGDASGGPSAGGA